MEVYWHVYQYSAPFKTQLYKDWWINVNKFETTCTVVDKNICERVCGAESNWNLAYNFSSSVDCWRNFNLHSDVRLIIHCLLTVIELSILLAVASPVAREPDTHATVIIYTKNSVQYITFLIIVTRTLYKINYFIYLMHNVISALKMPWLMPKPIDPDYSRCQDCAGCLHEYVYEIE